MEGFKRWGIWGDWDNPYLTLKKSLIFVLCYFEISFEDIENIGDQ